MSQYCPNLVDTSVITSDSQIILPWTIIQFNDSYSIMEFFHEGVKFRLEDDDCVLHAAFIGYEKHMLDHVDLSLPLVAVVVNIFNIKLIGLIQLSLQLVTTRKFLYHLLSQSLKETNEMLFITK